MQTTTAALLCLALNVYNEARGEPLKGQRAVAEVTLRRFQSDNFPNTLCGVVFQNKQFSWTLQPMSIKDNLALDIAMSIATDVYYNGYKITTCATNFYNPKQAHPKWADTLYTETTIAHHTFLCTYKPEQ